MTIHTAGSDSISTIPASAPTLSFGALLPTRPSYLAAIPGLEEAGYREAWFPDFQLAGADPFVTMACWAARTEKMNFGVCVCNPVTRHVTVVASLLASLNAEFPGRVGLGIGVGASPLKALGLKAAKLSELRDYVQQCRALMSGEPTELSEQAGPIRFLEFWRNALIDTPDVPIRIAAGGPVALRQAGMIADEVIIGTIDEQILRLQIARVREGAEAAGRDPSQIGVAVLAAVYLGSEKPTLDELREHVGGYVPNMLVSNGAVLRGYEDQVDPELVSAFSLVEQIQERVLSDAKRASGTPSAAFERYMESYPAQYDALVNAATLRAKALFGDADSISSRLSRLAELGVTKVILFPDPKDEGALGAFAERFIER